VFPVRFRSQDQVR